MGIKYRMEWFTSFIGVLVGLSVLGMAILLIPRVRNKMRGEGVPMYVMIALAFYPLTLAFDAFAFMKAFCGWF